MTMPAEPAREPSGYAGVVDQAFAVELTYLSPHICRARIQSLARLVLFPSSSYIQEGRLVIAHVSVFFIQPYHHQAMTIKKHLPLCKGLVYSSVVFNRSKKGLKVW